MAQHKSAQKRNRQTERREKVNTTRVTNIRTAVKKVEAAIATGDIKKAQEAFKAAKPVIMSGVSKGVIKKETASRKVSRLSSKVKAVSST